MITQTKQRFARTVFTPLDRAEPCRAPYKRIRRIRTQNVKQNLINGTARLERGGKDSKQTRTQQKKGCIPWEKVFLVEKNQGTT